MWVNGEKGPICTCKWPTFVKILNGKASLMCFGHTSQGLILPLPEGKQLAKFNRRRNAKPYKRRISIS